MPCAKTPPAFNHFLYLVTIRSMHQIFYFVFLKVLNSRASWFNTSQRLNLRAQMHELRGYQDMAISYTDPKHRLRQKWKTAHYVIRDRVPRGLIDPLSIEERITEHHTRLWYWKIRTHRLTELNTDSKRHNKVWWSHRLLWAATSGSFQM